MGDLVLKPLPPKDALAAFRGRRLELSGSWQDLWHEEHARAFTVARVASLDLLQSVHEELGKALEAGLTKDQFQKAMFGRLQAEGWLGEASRDAEGAARLGRPGRLDLIYDVNLRTAHAAGQWGRIERLKARMPFLRYSTQNDARVRPQHRAWEGITLPVDDPFWDTHFPPNGWRCRCTVSQWSQADLEAAGFSVTPPEHLPPDELVRFVNKRTGEETFVPRGIDPGWAYNPGKAGNAALGTRLGERLLTADPTLASHALQAAGRAFTEPLKAQLRSWAAAVEGGALKATGNQVVIGVLDPRTLAYLVARGIPLDTAAISLSDREFLHMLRPPKVARGAAWAESMVLDLPERLLSPEAIYWDTQDGVVVYAWATEDKTAKAVIRVNYRVKTEGRKLRTNLVKTTGLVHPANLANARYTRIQ